MSFKYVKTIFSLLIITGVISVFVFYEKFCDGSSECACRNAAAGDPTCFSSEQIEVWCESLIDRSEHPQCRSY